MHRFVWHNDPKSFEQLVARWDKRVFAFLAKASGNPDEAKDLRQEVFIRVYKHAATFDSKQKFSTWLFSIVHNVLATWYTKKKRRNLIELPQHFDAALSTVGKSRTPSTEAIAAEQKVVIDAAIARLKPCER
ncbi:MAG: sigma-70 family RNA polymerase sigma factor [Candidatus Hydrogenedentota bacterium]